MGTVLQDDMQAMDRLYGRNVMEYAESRRFLGREILAGMDPVDVAREANGIGAEWMSAGAREWLTNFLWIFQEAAALHDVHFGRNKDRSPASFRRVNWQFLANCLISVWDRCPRFGGKFWCAVAAAVVVHGLVRDFGWKAWCEGPGGGRKVENVAADD